MVDITPLIPKGKKIIESYGNGGFRISEEKFSGSVVVLPDEVFTLSKNNFSEIDSSDFSKIIENASKIEILLIGAGERIDFLPAEVERNLKDKNISVEYMDTGAACRTYNVLLSEERSVAAFLIAV